MGRGAAPWLSRMLLPTERVASFTWRHVLRTNDVQLERSRVLVGSVMSMIVLENV